MALQIRRGPTAQRLLKTFAEGEIIFDTDLQEVFIGDGETLGGKAVTTYTDANAVDAVGAALESATGNVTFTYDGEGGIEATVTLDGTYNDVVQDTTPQLGGDLDLNSNDITGTGNIDITGSVTASAGFVGDLTGNADTVTNGVYTNSTFYIGTTNLAFNRATNEQTLSGISISGNAATASKLENIRTINGVDFDGTADIVVADSTKLPTTGGTVSGNLIVGGDLTVNGTTTTVNSTTLDVVDLNITIAKDAANAAAANGAGLTIAGANATITYNSSNDRIVINKDITANVVGNVTGDVTGNVSGSSGSTTGNAATVTNGVYTSGDQEINGVKSFLSGITGNLTGDVNGNVTGNVTGSVYGSVYAFDSSQMVDSSSKEITASRVTVSNLYARETNLSCNSNVLFLADADFEGTTYFLGENPADFLSGIRVSSIIQPSPDFVDVAHVLITPTKTTFATPVQFGRYTTTERDALRDVVNNLSAMDAADASTIDSVLRLDMTASQPYPPFVIGDSVTISGVTPVEYNGTRTVVECTTTVISFANNTGITDPVTVGGTIAGPVSNGTVIYNSTLAKFQGRAGGAWVDLN
jgi:hypothetical protein